MKKEEQLKTAHVGKQPIVFYEEAFSKEECMQLREIFAGDEQEHDLMEGPGGKKLTFISLYKSPCTKWVYDRVIAFCKKANAENFKFSKELWPVRDMYINRYSAEAGDHRGWHVDGVLTNEPDYVTRKLSVVVQLSDDDEYTGGDFNLMAYHNPTNDDAAAIRKIGTLMVFPAFEWHRITQVTSGDRFSLVLFVHGVPFK